jgi:hypothetical protein
MGSQEWGGETVDAASSGSQFEELVDELNLTPNIFPAYPTSLPLPDHVHGFVTLNRSLRRLEFSEPLLGVHPAFDYQSSYSGKLQHIRCVGIAVARIRSGDWPSCLPISVMLTSPIPIGTSPTRRS